MNAACARHRLIQIVVTAAIVLASVSAYSSLKDVHLLERVYEDSPAADVQRFPWQLECHDLTGFYAVFEADR